VGELRDQLQQAEAAVQQYKIANNLLSAEGATLTEQEISGLNQQLASRARTGRDRRPPVHRPQPIGARQHRRRRRRIAELARGAATAQAARRPERPGRRPGGRYGDRHPDLLKAKRELADIDSQIQAEIRRIISNLEAQAQVARQRTGSMASSVASSKGTLAGNNRASIRLAELERKSSRSRRSMKACWLASSRPRPTRASSRPTPAWCHRPRSRLRRAIPSLR
jgi:succinoglycan biosynthesis transport protein ExoP